ncbi:MAG: hypothetical protein ACRDRJ_13765 [Streptosporangiaceae bacterium]
MIMSRIIRYLDTTASGADAAEEACTGVGSGVCSRTGNRPVWVKAEPTQSLRFFTSALLNQQLRQLRGGIPIAGVGSGAQLVEVAALGQQPGQFSCCTRRLRNSFGNTYRQDPMK